MSVTTGARGRGAPGGIPGGIIVLSLALAATSACRKQAEPEPAALPPPVSEAEATRGLAA